MGCHPRRAGHETPAGRRAPAARPPTGTVRRGGNAYARDRLRGAGRCVRPRSDGRRCPRPSCLFHAGRAATGTGEQVPVADATWDLFLPPSYEALASHGTMVTTQIDDAPACCGERREVALRSRRCANPRAGRIQFTFTDASQDSMSRPVSALREICRPVVRRRRRVRAGPRSAAGSASAARREAPARRRAGAEHGASCSCITEPPWRAQPRHRARSAVVPSIRFESFGAAPSVEVVRREHAAPRVHRGRDRDDRRDAGACVRSNGAPAGAVRPLGWGWWRRPSPWSRGNGLATHAANAAFYATAMLVPLFLALAALRWMVRIRASRLAALPPGVTGTLTAALLISCLAAVDRPASADDD